MKNTPYSLFSYLLATLMAIILAFAKLLSPVAALGTLAFLSLSYFTSEEWEHPLEGRWD